MNAVVTICVGAQYKKIAELTHKSIKSYADKIGAEFICIRESKCSTPHWDKFEIYNLLNKYERIIYLDTDLLVRSDCPNLFDIVPIAMIGLFNEAPYTDGRIVVFNQACTEHAIKIQRWNGFYYNTGVMVISRQHKQLFRKPDIESCIYYEQSYFNVILAKLQIQVFNLEYRYNRMTCMDGFTGEDRLASYIIHYAGFPNLDIVLQLIHKDIVRWDNDKPNFIYRRHLLIDVRGGLGDQVCAEPAIRYLINNVYPGEDIAIKTHFIEIFKHLGVPVFEHSDFIYKTDTPYYHIVTLPGPETHMWFIVSNLLCHTVDFVSMALLRRILPNSDKTIKLVVNPRDIDNVRSMLGDIDYSKLVLIHAGQHWESKTFPIAWWQEIVDRLCKQVKVCLIGFNDDTRGVLPVIVRDGVVDTRNLLTLDELIALISMSNIILSNDSAPIHIAGAFDINIVLIPTCKHPDHLLPWRCGSQYYKANALYKKLTLDSCDCRPTTVHDTAAEFISGNILDYLPDPIDVINCINNIVAKK